MPRLFLGFFALSALGLIFYTSTRIQKSKARVFSDATEIEVSRAPASNAEGRALAVAQISNTLGSPGAPPLTDKAMAEQLSRAWVFDGDMAYADEVYAAYRRACEAGDIASCSLLGRELRQVCRDKLQQKETDIPECTEGKKLVLSACHQGFSDSCFEALTLGKDSPELRAEILGVALRGCESGRTSMCSALDSGLDDEINFRREHGVDGIAALEKKFSEVTLSNCEKSEQADFSCVLYLGKAPAGDVKIREVNARLEQMCGREPADGNCIEFARTLADRQKDLRSAVATIDRACMAGNGEACIQAAYIGSREIEPQKQVARIEAYCKLTGGGEDPAPVCSAIAGAPLPLTWESIRTRTIPTFDGTPSALTIEEFFDRR